MPNAIARRALASGSRLSIGWRSCSIALSRCVPTPGKGSVFRIVVPLADQQLPGAQTAPEAPVSAMPRGLILVIDDDAVIQGAMQSLLSSWGHDVVAAGSCAEMLERIATSFRRPDLIVCDYRLRDGENGIDVIKRLQSEYNDDIPAVLVTGDTAPDRLRDAQESGLILLHKPVANIEAEGSGRQSDARARLQQWGGAARRRVRCLRNAQSASSTTSARRSYPPCFRPRTH